jgi:hypothetical protein
MSTPRFLILPDLIVNVDDIVAASLFSEDGENTTAIDLRNDRDTVYTSSTVAEVAAALREAMKVPTEPYDAEDAGYRKGSNAATLANENRNAALLEALAAAEAELVAWANWDSYGTPAKGPSLDALTKAYEANCATRASLGLPEIGEGK